MHKNLELHLITPPSSSDGWYFLAQSVLGKLHIRICLLMEKTIMGFQQLTDWLTFCDLNKVVNYRQQVVWDDPDILLKSVSKWMFLYKCPIYDHSWPFFRHMCEFLSQNWGSDGHFEVLNRAYLWLVEKLWHKMQIFPFLFFLPFFTKTEVSIFCFFCVFVFFVITFVPIKI